jgi:hypothetical protein
MPWYRSAGLVTRCRSYVGETVTVHEMAARLEIFHAGELVARHDKAARHSVVMLPEHYAGLLRPGRVAALLPAPPRWDPAYLSLGDVAVRDLRIYPVGDTLTVKPVVSSGILKSVTLNPTVVTGGQTAQGTVTLQGPVGNDTVVGVAAMETGLHFRVRTTHRQLQPLRTNPRLSRRIYDGDVHRRNIRGGPMLRERPRSWHTRS